MAVEVSIVPSLAFPAGVVAEIACAQCCGYCHHCHLGIVKRISELWSARLDGEAGSYRAHILK